MDEIMSEKQVFAVGNFVTILSDKYLYNGCEGVITNLPGKKGDDYHIDVRDEAERDHNQPYKEGEFIKSKDPEFCECPTEEDSGEVAPWPANMEHIDTLRKKSDIHQEHIVNHYDMMQSIDKTIITGAVCLGVVTLIVIGIVTYLILWHGNDILI